MNKATPTRPAPEPIVFCTYANEEALDLLESRKHEVLVAPAPGPLYARVHEAQSFGIGRTEAERMGAVSGLELMQALYPIMSRSATSNRSASAPAE